MAEYIEREALLKSKDWLSLQDFDRARAKVIILGRPAADMVEVRHGEWEMQKFPITMCSVCGALRNCETERGWNYCPNCGAKMDGKGDGE